LKRYDPSKSPDSVEWLALDEGERIEAVREYHQRHRIRLPNVKAHAIAHAIIENQLAEGLPAARSALARLLADGLDRHESIHAMGSVLMAHLWNLTNRPAPEGDPNDAYLAALDDLSVDSWRRSG
jgi:hypothetical protein